MDYHAFSDETLAAMYFCLRGALAADDELRELGAEPRFRVRDTPAWQIHAADLEAEMIRRQMEFEFADWGERGLAGQLEGPNTATFVKRGNHAWNPLNRILAIIVLCWTTILRTRLFQFGDLS